jgi:hypothetical protein
VTEADGEPSVSTTDDLRRLTDQSRVRLASVEALREQHLLITRRSRRCLEDSRLLLQPGPQALPAPTAVPAARAGPAAQV